MPRRRKPAFARPTPIQLPLFAETASLVRIRPALNEWRYYRMEIWPDLFGRALLVRQWGRIGTEGRRRLDPHPDSGAAIQCPCRHSAGQAPPRLPGSRRVKAPRRTPARVGKVAGKAATIPRASAGVPPKRAHVISKANARKSRAESPAPAPQTGMQLHTAAGNPQISDRRRARCLPARSRPG
jgi:predicted DNA-binding WGR domain protein